MNWSPRATPLPGPRSPSNGVLCGEIRELWPYGLNGETICYECATSTPKMKAAAERAMKRMLE